MATTEADAKEGEATVAVVTAAVAMSAVTMVLEVTVVEVAAAEKSAVEATVAVAGLMVGKIVSALSPRLQPHLHGLTCPSQRRPAPGVQQSVSHAHNHVYWPPPAWSTLSREESQTSSTVQYCIAIRVKAGTG